MSILGQFQFRRDLAANWTSLNPILLNGEMGIESDTDNFKLGDGVTPWNLLPYGGLVGAKGDKGDQGDIGLQGQKGWSPVLAAVVDGVRRVLQLVDWTGGEGVKPATGQYLGPTGFVTNIADATNLRGGTGPQPPLSTATPQPIGTPSAGTATDASPSDHVHGHGDQSGGSLHALADISNAGFMSPTQVQQMAALFGDVLYFVENYGTLVSGTDTATVSGAQATANRNAIQAAINAAQSSIAKKPGGTVVLPPGTFHIDSTITINESAVKLLGAGAYGNTDTSGVAQTGRGTTLFWNNTSSPATTAMVDVVSVQGTTNPAVKNSGIIGMSLQCAGNVGIGLRVKSIHWGVFKDIYIINPTSRGVSSECFITGTELGEAADVTKCDFERIRVRLLEAPATASGFFLTGASNANTSNSTFRNIAVSCQGTQLALDIGNTDSNSFYDVRVNQSNGATVQPVRFRGGTAVGLEARGNVFYYIACGGSSTGLRGMYSEGTETAGVTAPAKNNVIFGYSIENGEPLPVIGTGSDLQYQTAGGIFSARPTLTNATTTTETIVARWQVPENYFTAGLCSNVRFNGQGSGTATLIYRIRVGTAGTTADPLVIQFATSAAGVANAHSGVDGVITCLTQGATGTLTAGGLASLANAALGPATAAFAAATVNTTARLFVSVSVQQSAAQTLTARAGSLSRIV